MAESWNLSERERTELVSQVSRLHGMLLAEIEGMTVSAWNARPDPDTWSAGEIVEHVLMVEAGLMRQVLARSGDAPQADWEVRLQGKEETLRKVLPGGGKAKAGASVTLFQGLGFDRVADGLAQSRESLDGLLATTKDLPLKAILWNNRYFGDLSAYLWLLYIPLHGERHLGQLRRLKGLC